MRYLSNPETGNVNKYLERCIELALKASCERHKCGSVIVKNNQIIGEGYNTPPGQLLNQNNSQKRCHIKKDEYNLKVTDKTCCVHAEQRAIFDALKKYGDEIEGSTIYFMRIDKNDRPTFAGKPYCTICSKSILDVGISTFILKTEQGIISYDTEEYNNLSFEYGE
ncbi:hypothetical protein HN385_07515 [archaeon]|jgi:deoxycytidylate deaminase|nr:hypothetical protein [archaeon]MBT3451172.1 hypothetical protein [archaeon]MBT6869706.1 hypothetical protein [archaeon]MBT7192635.1 hypothetical protein [archaeon]MBT7380520.1 hypothetical protein [archaeon]